MNELSRLSGVEPSAISRLVTGKRFLQVEALDRLAAGLKLRVVSGVSEGRLAWRISWRFPVVQTSANRHEAGRLHRQLPSR